MKTAILFAGQGAQAVGMGQEFYEKYPAFAAALDKAQTLVDFDLKKLMFEGPAEQLSRTAYTQPALAAYAAGAVAVLREKGFQPDYVAGLSLGEYSALHAAGVFDLETLIRTTAFRGKAMESCGKGLDTKMSAVLGLEAETVSRLCAEASDARGEIVEVSNYNAKGQIVISGIRVAVEEAERMAMEAGAKRCMPLNVSSAFHTCFMQQASEDLKKYFETIYFGKMQVPVIFNATGAPLVMEQTGDTAMVKNESAEIQKLLELQVKTGVRMMQTILFLKEAGVEQIIEVGPGKTLAGFVRKTVTGVKVIPWEKYVEM